MCGNEACGEGAVLAGCRLYAGYPITPQNELTAYMSKRMSETGRIFIQAESELAAINMVFGAAAAGARAMTSSSSPGISLKQEGISYIAACELPAVIVNVQRGGPGLGNIAPAQSDYFQSVKGGGHGDYRLIVLAPASVQDMLDYTFHAFDLADKYRNPVLILADGLLGQMMEPLDLKSTVHSPQSIEKPWALTGCAGRKANFIRSLILTDAELEAHNIKLQAKYAVIKENETRAETYNMKNAEIVIVAYGSMARIGKAVVERCRAKGLKVGLIRPVTLWPFPDKIIREAAETAKKFLVVEMSAGQMVEDVMLSVLGNAEVHFYGRMGGMIPSEEEITAKVEAIA